MPKVERKGQQPVPRDHLFKSYVARNCLRKQSHESRFLEVLRLALDFAIAARAYACLLTRNVKIPNAAKHEAALQKRAGAAYLYMRR